MRRTACRLAFGALALVLPACVSNSDVPSTTAVPAPTLAPSAASVLVATPSTLTMSVSAVVPPYPSVTVSQPGTASVPYLIAAQSTCLTSGDAGLAGNVVAGDANTFQLVPLRAGSCTLQFGGTSGVELTYPVTVIP